MEWMKNIGSITNRRENGQILIRETAVTKQEHYTRYATEFVETCSSWNLLQCTYSARNFSTSIFSTVTEKRILLFGQSNGRIQDGKAARNAYRAIEYEWLDL